jgi:hypothetical protein
MSGTLRIKLAQCFRDAYNPGMATDAFLSDADAALAALRQWLADEGLVIVPAEPTPRMFEANSKCTSQELWAGIGWAAMLSAAPATGLE